MKYGFFTTLLNPSNSHCNGAIRMTWFKAQAVGIYDSGTQKLVPRFNKCLDNAGDFIEK
jgi:hypothetical protein